MTDKETFSSGAVRDVRSGKGRYDLLTGFSHALRRVAEVLERGAEHYGDRNWEKGMNVSRCVDSGLRHIFKWAEGQTSEDHLAHACWNFLAAAQMESLAFRGERAQEFLDMGPYAAYSSAEITHDTDETVDGDSSDVADSIWDNDSPREPDLSYWLLPAPPAYTYEQSVWGPDFFDGPSDALINLAVKTPRKQGIINHEAGGEVGCEAGSGQRPSGTSGSRLDGGGVLYSYLAQTNRSRSVGGDFGFIDDGLPSG